MAKGYGIDLRRRVIDYINEGNTIEEAASLFKVGVSTVYKWLRLLRESGSLKHRKQGTPGKRKIDYEALEQYVKDHPDATLHEMGRVFNVRHSAIEKVLIKLKITRKKKRVVQRGLSGKARRISSGNRQDSA